MTDSLNHMLNVAVTIKMSKLTNVTTEQAQPSMTINNTNAMMITHRKLYAGVGGVGERDGQQHHILLA